MEGYFCSLKDSFDKLYRVSGLEIIWLWQFVHLASGLFVNHSSLSLLINTPAGNTGFLF